MIKFFRRIRQKLLSENKFSKYLLYAIGEIILVVIGILIALQINNWNESRKQDSKTKHLIERLKKETQENIQSISYGIELAEKANSDIITLIQMFGESVDESHIATMDSLMIMFTSDYTLGLNLNTLIEARDNGEISLIKSDSLRARLYQLASINNLVIEREKIANGDNNSYLVPFLYKNTNRRSIHSKVFNTNKNKIGLSKLEATNYATLLSNREFENLVNSRFNYSEELTSIYKNVKSFLIDLNQRLENEDD